MEDEAPIRAVLNDGRTVPCHVCNCAKCGNEFFVPGYSDEWMPNYCPYCGIKFVRRTRDGEPMDYSPAPTG
jgi:DNA-directed RNA polymerase subunit RPC12/RpoP